MLFAMLVFTGSIYFIFMPLLFSAMILTGNAAQGALILVNTKNLLYMESVQILWTIKKNIQFYFEYKNNNTIRKYENNELFQKRFINEIKNELDKKIYSLVIDRTYKNIS